MKKDLVLASNNKGKILEIKELLGDVYNIKTMGELGFKSEIIENGETFLQNALIKAKTISKHFNCDALSDDSGLCVNALNDEPGVYSARYSGALSTDKLNNDLLLKNLTCIENRNAKFVCVVVIYRADGSYIFGQGECQGKILHKGLGENGFGYDPLFYSYELKKTFAQATNNEKNSISHRYRAIIDLKTKI